MKMRENFIDIYNLFSNDEILLRLLYYKPLDQQDDPLDSNKPNILSLDNKNKWEIIEDVIKTTDTTSDLIDKEKCIVFFYGGRRDSRSSRNYLFANQEIVIDIFVHFSFENIDMRLSWICDRINDLLFGSRVHGGIGKTFFKSGGKLAAPSNYTAYRLVYEFGSGN